MTIQNVVKCFHDVATCASQGKMRQITLIIATIHYFERKQHFTKLTDVEELMMVHDCVLTNIHNL